jgi:1-acyl-sn-glycerol-3-phosphate acyltransferase
MVVAPVLWFSPVTDRAWRRMMFKFWGRVAWRIIGMRVEVHGTPPKPPYFQVTNHVSYLDTMLMAGVLGCVFVAKAEMEHWPVFGLIARGMGTIFIKRERLRDTVRVNNLITRVIDADEGLQVFAESTTSQGIEVRPFKTALLEPAADRCFPVHYAAITYRTPEGCPPASDVVCWWTMVAFLSHALNLFRLPYFYASVTFGDAPIVADDRKVLAQKLHDAVQAIFVPVLQGPKTMEKAMKEGIPNYPFAS